MLVKSRSHIKVMMHDVNFTKDEFLYHLADFFEFVLTSGPQPGG